MWYMLRQRPGRSTSKEVTPDQATCAGSWTVP
jgi:hypothetical protein